MQKQPPEVFNKKAVLKNFTGKHLSLFLINLQVSGVPNIGAFFVNIAKFLRTPILKNICERLLLTMAATRITAIVLPCCR